MDQPNHFDSLPIGVRDSPAVQKANGFQSDAIKWSPTCSATGESNIADIRSTDLNSGLIIDTQSLDVSTQLQHEAAGHSSLAADLNASINGLSVLDRAETTASSELHLAVTAESSGEDVAAPNTNDPEDQEHIHKITSKGEATGNSAEISKHSIQEPSKEPLNGPLTEQIKSSSNEPPKFPNIDPRAPTKFSPKDGQPPFSVENEQTLNDAFISHVEFLEKALSELQEETVSGEIDDPNLNAVVVGATATDVAHSRPETEGQRNSTENCAIDDALSLNNDWSSQRKIPVSLRAGGSASLKITHMAEMGVLKIGDVWRYSRVFNAKSLGKGRTEVKKECIMTGFDRKTFALSFSVPAGTDTHILREGNAVNIQNVTTPTTFETLLLDEDKRVKSSERPNGNAFKCFRIMRNGEDIGSLWDVRGRAFGQDSSMF